jgi:CRISPR-associated protein Cas6
MEVSADSVVDVVFGLDGASLPAEYAYDLWREVHRRLAWLEDEASAGIHPLKTSPGGEGVVLLARRAKLVLRVPERRLGDALALAGTRLDVGSGLAVSGGAAKPLHPWHTLHAQRVATGARDEAAFGDEVAGWLAARAVVCEFITGQRRTHRAGPREISGFSVVLHGVKPADSLGLQFEGMGGERGLGWGLFVPYKSILAVV